MRSTRRLCKRQLRLQGRIHRIDLHRDPTTMLFWLRLELFRRLRRRFFFFILLRFFMLMRPVQFVACPRIILLVCSAV